MIIDNNFNPNNNNFIKPMPNINKNSNPSPMPYKNNNPVRPEMLMDNDMSNQALNILKQRYESGLIYLTIINIDNIIYCNNRCYNKRGYYESCYNCCKW